MKDSIQDEEDVKKESEYRIPSISSKSKSSSLTYFVTQVSSTESPIDTDTAATTASADAKTITSPPDLTTTATATSESTDGTDSDSPSVRKHTSITSATSKSKNSHKSHSISVDPAAGPGGISMITPPVTAGQTFVKIGTNVTFAWNYTSLTITPSGIDVLAWNADASRAYTITHNATVHPTQTVIWDTKDYMQTAESDPLVNGKYTLMIYDSEYGPTHIADAGHLGAFTQYYFGIYSPQPYTPWSSWKCDSCNSAPSSVERQSLQFAFAMAAITLLSFGCFLNALASLV
ncbi:hypothetical protein KEM54_006415 [Ascosphaera aggregata]|nr:hypothetical protein KEM54_006415 [Ascosphaera aggregata]